MLDPLYQWIGGLAEAGYLPDLLRHSFMTRAFLASILLAPLLGVILAASRANLGVAAGTVLIVSFLSPFLDPVSDAVGGWLLGLPALQSMWTQLYNMPVVPWTSFNNSVVLGSFVLGLILLYPMYKASKPLFKKYSERLSKWARKFRLTRALLGAEWADRFGTAGQA